MTRKMTLDEQWNERAKIDWPKNLTEFDVVFREWESLVVRRNAMLDSWKILFCFDFVDQNRISTFEIESMGWTQTNGRIDSFSQPIAGPKQTKNEICCKKTFTLCGVAFFRYTWHNLHVVGTKGFISVFFFFSRTSTFNLMPFRIPNDWRPVEKNINRIIIRKRTRYIDSVHRPLHFHTWLQWAARRKKIRI